MTSNMLDLDYEEGDNSKVIKRDKLVSAMDRRKTAHSRAQKFKSEPGLFPTRSAMVFPPEHQAVSEFGCKISTDVRKCMFWGGDITDSGEIVVPDWYNSTVKVFGRNGQYITSLKFPDPPLDVTALPGNVLVVTYGSVSQHVSLLSFNGRQLRMQYMVPLRGHMFSTTRFRGRCLGVYRPEEDDITTMSLATVSCDDGGKFIQFGLEKIQCDIFTDSGITYDGQNIYFTHSKTLSCVTKDGDLIFEKNIVDAETSDDCQLGSMSSCNRGELFIASDTCVLRVTTSGELIGKIRTISDPYHVMVDRTGTKLAVVGKEDNIELYTLSAF